MQRVIRAIRVRLGLALTAILTGGVVTAEERDRNVEAWRRRAERAEAKADVFAERIETLKEKLAESRAETRRKSELLRSGAGR